MARALLVVLASSYVLPETALGSATDDYAPPSPTGRAPSAPGSAAASQASGAVIDGRILEVAVGQGTMTSQRVNAGTSSARPRCTYTRFTQWTPHDRTGQSAEVEFGAVAAYRSITTREPATQPGPGVEQLTQVRCPGQGTSWRWLPTREAVDINALIANARNKAQALIPLPAPNMSPAPEYGAPAHLGLWLAVADPGQVNVIAQVADVWASVTARFVTVTWNLGNGVEINCNGLGTPYPIGSATKEQGPCGHTFTTAADLGPHTITATASWDIWLETSTGRSESLGRHSVTTTFDYEVYEIVTVGAPAA